MAKLNVSISTARTAATLARDLQRTDKYATIQAITRLLQSVLSGNDMNPVVTSAVDDNATPASGTITLTGAGAANDTILINGVTFTAQASGATGNQWNVGANATASAVAIAAAINASASALVNQHVTATSAAGVVTITSVVRGVYGNAVTIAKGVDAAERDDRFGRSPHWRRG
jgi:phage tail sheath gpL-like